LAEEEQWVDFGAQRIQDQDASSERAVLSTPEAPSQKIRISCELDRVNLERLDTLKKKWSLLTRGEVLDRILHEMARSA
jgi:hypothetical protein